MRGSVGYPGVGDTNIPEFIGDSDGHLQGSLECAGESLELFTVRALAKRVLPCADHFVQTDGGVSGTQVQTTAACSQLGNHQGSGGQNDFRNIKSWASVVSYEVFYALNSRAGGWESLSHPS